MNEIDGREVSPYQRHLERFDAEGLVRVIQRLAAQEARGRARRAEAIARLRSLACMTADEAPVAIVTAIEREVMLDHEVAGALRIAPWQAERDVRVAMALDERMFATMSLLRAGDLSYEKVQALARTAIPLGDWTFQEARRAGLSPRKAEAAACDMVRRLEQMVLPKAPELTPGQVSRRTEKAVATLCPRFVEDRRREAIRCRSVDPPARSSDDPDGQSMQNFFARLPAPEAQAVWNTVDAYARAMRDAGDERTLEELRADVLTHLVLRGHPPNDIHIAGPNTPPTPNPGPANPARSPASNSTPNPAPNPGPEPRPASGGSTATAPAAHPAPPPPSATTNTTTTGPGQPLDDRSATAPMDWSSVGTMDKYGLRANVQVVVSLETLLGLSDAPGHLAGHGMITAQVARDIAFKEGGTWQRLVIDERGQVIDYGTTKYLPPKPLKRFVRARDRSCRTPWCDRPAGTCDSDHVTSYPTGPTNAHNLQCKCRRCHRLKHEGRWKHEVLKDGTIRMISPAGIEHFSEPEDLRPIPVPPPRARQPIPDLGDPPF